ncbi:MarR family transcriptional regulator [Nocardioides sp. GY 10113]|uniref:MarR family transcriptional regulator n=1 Tax=Nocardioides sp. GY 10113 TaxID=2569761 RepID=UPI0010A81F60|nr:MarR family transcriptional regulator [Nocardioides sp. GY 10113]TIC84890.1 MarR family transcriptional regulator [Nocardioides sp. GY 10113]
MTGPGTSFVEGWAQDGSLQALRAAIERGGRLRHVIARRARLTTSDLVALEHLMSRPLGPAELARILDVSTAAATALVDRLAQRAHVRRRPHERDRRRTEVEITPDGREEVLSQLLPMFVALDRLDRSFTDAERAVVERYLRGVVAVFDEVEAEEPTGARG